MADSSVAAVAVEEEYFSDQDVPRGMNGGLVADRGDSSGKKRNETVQTAGERLPPVEVAPQHVVVGRAGPLDYPSCFIPFLSGRV